MDVRVGFDEAPHATALGKCLIAQLDEHHRRDYLARHQLADLTPHTITEPRRLLRTLRSSTGLSIDREEYALGTGCIAVPVTDATGTVRAALAVSCRPTKLPKIERSTDRLKATAARIQRTITLPVA